MNPMTLEDVEELVRTHTVGDLTAINHGIRLNQALISPQRISVIARNVQEGHVTDEQLSVWLVGQESFDDGYKIILRDDGLQFGLAYKGFPADKYPILVGWYGSLKSAFLGM